MSLLFRYIVFLFLTFNICTANAAEVIFELDEEDVENLEIPSFIEAGNLPHPVQLRQIINQSNHSPIGRLLILGQYFEARYPRDALNVDFREDVALIFPEMSAEEVQKTTTYIKAAIRLYRLSKEKINEIKKEKLAPKDPPLMVSDDQYALLGDQEYIPTNDDEVAIISDFKKVVGYSGNPRELEAMEAYVDRVRSQNKKETDYEHFRSMLKKLDWRALTSYGVTQPSPFVGKAGIGSFVENEDFKARLLSDTARIGNQKEMIFGLHMVVPNHRFMLATNLNEKLHKPRIELIAAENVADMKALMPMPIQAVTDELVGAYRGNFAFPLRITLGEPNKPAYLKVRITFESCDADLDCQTVVMEPDLDVDAKDEGKRVWSSMSNFIHQSFYNLPQKTNENLVLTDVSYTKNEAGEIVKLNLDFKYKGKIRNFAFFLENEENTIFRSPEVIVGKDHIYIQAEPIEGTESLLDKPLVLTARLNDFVSIRQTLDFHKDLQKGLGHGMFAVLVLGLVCGLLFYVSPFGWPLAYMGFFENKNLKEKVRFLASKILFLCVLILYFVHMEAKDSTLIYTLFAPSVFECAVLFLALIALLFYIGTRLYEKINAPFVSGAMTAGLTVLVLIVYGVPLTEQFWTAYVSSTLYAQAVLFAGGVVGLVVPDVCALYFRNKKIPPKLVELFAVFAKCVICIALAILGMWMMFPLEAKTMMIVFVWLVVGLFILQYLFAFWRALYRTDLKASHILWTSRVLFVLVLLTGYGFSTLARKYAAPKTTPIPSFSSDEIMHRAQNGENMIVAFEYPSCVICKYNMLTVFNASTLLKLKEEYKLTYLNHSVEKPDMLTLDFMKKYRRFSRPIYILYTPLAPNGVVLPDLLSLSGLGDVFEMFRIYPSSSKSEPRKSLNTNLR